MSWPLGFPVPSMPTEALWGSPDAPWGSGTDGLGFESQTDPPCHGPGSPWTGTPSALSLLVLSALVLSSVKWGQSYVMTAHCE